MIPYDLFKWKIFFFFFNKNLLLKAASTLKGADGLLTLVIAKPSKSVQDTISEESKSSKENLQSTKVIKDKSKYII